MKCLNKFQITDNSLSHIECAYVRNWQEGSCFREITLQVIFVKVS